MNTFADIGNIAAIETNQWILQPKTNTKNTIILATQYISCNDLIYTTTDIREVIVNSLIKSDRKIFEFMFVSGACFSLCRILCDFFAFCLLTSLLK